MFCPKCGEQISVREKKEDAEKIRRLREALVALSSMASGVFAVTVGDLGIYKILEECK